MNVPLSSGSSSAVILSQALRTECRTEFSSAMVEQSMGGKLIMLGLFTDPSSLEASGENIVLEEGDFGAGGKVLLYNSV